MIVARTHGELIAAIDSCRAGLATDRSTVAFVPTMGSLHAGHLSLIARARSSAGITVASIYVNPLQFGPGEDFDRYPREQERDTELLIDAGCDVLFLPSSETVYPDGFSTKVLASEALSAPLCGRIRGASHFDGVATVVARLFALVSPDTAWFGEKDWQQLLVIRRMAADLFPSLSVMSAPTVRDAEGLALSSRNAYLAEDERAAALAVPGALIAARNAAAKGGNVNGCIDAARSVLASAAVSVDYVELLRGDDLAPTPGPFPEATDRIFIAARVGTTRLIDNDSLTPSSPALSENLPTPMASTARAAATG